MNEINEKKKKADSLVICEESKKSRDHTSTHLSNSTTTCRNV